jgi:RNA-directed DNA polymerase
MSLKSLSDLRNISDVATYLDTTKKQLVYLLYAIADSDRYSVHAIPKKRGGQRVIQSPRPELKYIQHRFADRLYEIYQPRPAVHGFSYGKSIVTNAQSHDRSRYIFNVDLKDFFPSINFGRVRGMFLKPPYQVSEDAATVLAQICCYQNALPQGAPTSPVISNMICARLDGQLIRLAKKFRCLFTRYVDDITFSLRSGGFPPEIGYKEGNDVYVGDELRRIITTNGFEVNSEKVHLHSNRERQRVTGLIVNQKPNVPRRYIRQVRAIIHAWEKYGEDAAEEEHARRYYRRTGCSHSVPPLRSIIRGKLEFLKMVKGVSDPVYKNLQRQLAGVWPEYQEVMKKEVSKMSARDVFISHASEDKNDIAKPLADALIAAGVSVWYDEYEIKWGDSLLQVIDRGLANSRYGIVILSKNFFGKRWPRRELDGLIALADAEGRNRVLPIWHNITFKEVSAASPTLAGQKALDTSKHDINEIVQYMVLLSKS